MTVEELMTTYHILKAKCKELYTKISDTQEAWHHHLDEMKDKAWTCDEPLYQKYQQLSIETNQAFEAFEAFKKLELGCVREERHDNILRAFR